MLSSNLSAFQTFLAAALYLLLAVSQSVSAQINSPTNTLTHTGGRERFYVVFYFQQSNVEKTLNFLCSFWLRVIACSSHWTDVTFLCIFSQIVNCMCVSCIIFFSCRASPLNEMKPPPSLFYQTTYVAEHLFQMISCNDEAIWCCGVILVGSCIS